MKNLLKQFKRWLTVLMLPALVFACGGPKDPGPVAPTPDEVDACAAFCSMECPGSEGTPGYDEVYGTEDDVSCTEACNDVLAGPEFDGNRACLDTVTTCMQAEECIFEGGFEEPVDAGT